MKKLSLYVFLGLLWCNVGFAEEIKLSCQYIKNYYQNWDQGEFGTTRFSHEMEGSEDLKIYFIIKKHEDGSYGFETNMPATWIKGQLTSKVSDAEYIFKITEKNAYNMLTLDRFTGELIYLSGYHNDGGRYQWKDYYNCKKAEQKF